MHAKFQTSITMLQSREYFKEVSIETETIVETIENGQGCDFKKNRNL